MQALSLGMWLTLPAVCAARRPLALRIECAQRSGRGLPGPSDTQPKTPQLYSHTHSTNRCNQPYLWYMCSSSSSCSENGVRPEIRQKMRTPRAHRSTAAVWPRDSTISGYSEQEQLFADWHPPFLGMASKSNFLHWQGYTVTTPPFLVR